MIDDLEARARRLLASPGNKRVEMVSGPPSQFGVARNRPDQVRWLMNCSRLVRPFVVVGEVTADGHSVSMLGNEPVASGPSGDGNGPPPALLGSFVIHTEKWPGCPHCRTKHNPSGQPRGFWRCDACGMFNCPGDRDGSYYCSCGCVVTSFVGMATFAVHGTRSLAAIPRAQASAPLAGVSPPPPRVPAPAPARIFSSPPLPPGPALRLPGRK